MKAEDKVWYVDKLGAKHRAIVLCAFEDDTINLVAWADGGAHVAYAERVTRDPDGAVNTWSERAE